MPDEIVRTVQNHAAFASDESWGLSKREYFAAQALAALPVNVPIVFGFPKKEDFKAHAKKCVAMADALIDALNEKR